jgi:phage-related tail fiber protein
MVFTDDGRNLLAKAQTGVQLEFTRIAVGDGMLNGQDATKFKHLLDEVLSLSISEIIYSGSGQAVLKSVLNNESLSKGFYWREIGVFATDPQLGEILYAYTNANDGEIYVPDKATNIYTTPLNLNLYISNASNVTAVIDSSLVYATKQDIADIKSGVITVGMAAKVSNVLTFSGGSTVSFDGSAPQTVKIPSQPADVRAATAAQGDEADTAVQSATLDGKAVPKSGTTLQIPMPTAAQVGALPATTTALKNPSALTFSTGYGGDTGAYDGSTTKTVSIPKITITDTDPGSTYIGDGCLVGVYKTS